MELKINGIVYDITRQDRFLDNGKTIELITQSREPMSGGRRPNPVLRGWAKKKLQKHETTERVSTQYRGVELRIV